jgi:hypothetical protein
MILVVLLVPVGLLALLLGMERVERWTLSAMTTPPRRSDKS